MKFLHGVAIRSGLLLVRKYDWANRRCLSVDEHAYLNQWSSIRVKLVAGDILKQ